MLWLYPVTPEQINHFAPGTISEVLGIEFTEVGADYLVAKMPVDARTKQPYGLLHGGASVVLAETLGSVAAGLCIDVQTQSCVGLEINANHLRAVRSGYVLGKVTPVHIGKTTHVWSIEIVDEAGKKVCISRITMAILKK